MTQQRQIILEEIKKVCNHPTADEIYENVRKKLPRISMGTIYRNLETLSTLGFISKMEPDRTQMRFDGNTMEHYHITCMVCGRIEDAPLEPMDNTIENLENALGNLTKYGIFGHKLEFLGLCSSCMEEEEKKATCRDNEIT